MNRFLNPLTVAIGLWTVCVLTFVGCGGCAAGKGTYSPPTGTNTTGVYDASAPGDPLVISVESIRETALGLFDAAMRLEKQNQDSLMRLNPKIHVAVEQIRRDGPKALNALTDSKTAYQKSRSAADATTLRNALAALQSLVNSAITNLAEIAAATKGTP
jgi:hypothetical protein